MRLGIIADDFTGASDVANTICKGGLATVLAFNACPASLPKGFAAIVIALKTRSIPAADSVRESLQALDGLQRLGAAQIVFKICSTFDSTPAGNIGPVTEALADRFETKGAVVVCPAFPDASRTVYNEHLFVGDKLLSESGMENHPLNPMTDPDLRRWLGRQSRGAVGHLTSGGDSCRRNRYQGAARRRGEGRTKARYRRCRREQRSDDARALADAPLVTGSSGVAMGLARVHAVNESGAAPAIRRVDGPGAILAGSCSKATLAQIARYAADHAALAIDAVAVIAGETTPEDALRFIAAHPDDAPLLYSSVEPDVLHSIQSRHGIGKVATALEAFFGTLAREALARGIRRLVVAGGETSGAIVIATGATPTILDNSPRLGCRRLPTSSAPSIASPAWIVRSASKTPAGLRAKA